MKDDKKSENKSHKEEWEQDSWEAIDNVCFIFIEIKRSPFERLSCNGPHSLYDGGCDFIFFFALFNSLCHDIKALPLSQPRPRPPFFSFTAHTFVVFLLGVLIRGYCIEKFIGNNILLL